MRARARTLRDSERKLRSRCSGKREEGREDWKDDIGCGDAMQSAVWSISHRAHHSTGHIGWQSMSKNETLRYWYLV